MYFRQYFYIFWVITCNFFSKTKFWLILSDHLIRVAYLSFPILYFKHLIFLVLDDLFSNYSKGTVETKTRWSTRETCPHNIGFCWVFDSYFFLRIADANWKILKWPRHLIDDVLSTWISKAAFRSRITLELHNICVTPELLNPFL